MHKRTRLLPEYYDTQHNRARILELDKMHYLVRQCEWDLRGAGKGEVKRINKRLDEIIQAKGKI